VTPQSGNQVSTSLGNSGLCWTVFAQNRDTAVPAERHGDLQTVICVLVARPRRCLTLSNPYPLTKLNGSLSRLHSADEDAVLWLTNYGKWHTYEKKKNGNDATSNVYKWRHRNKTHSSYSELNLLENVYFRIFSLKMNRMTAFRNLFMERPCTSHLCLFFIRETKYLCHYRQAAAYRVGHHTSCYYLRQKNRYMFCPCSFVCLSVSKITKKCVHGFRWNVACRQMSRYGRTD